MSRSNRFRNITIVMALVGLLCASGLGADLTAIAFITLIGIPIAAVITILPTIALATVLAYLIWRFTPISGFIGIVGAYAAAIGLMLAVPPLHNIEVEAAIKRLTATDVEMTGVEVPPGGHNIVIGLPSTDRKGSRCDLTCMHLLVSRQVNAVVKTVINKEALAPDLSSGGYRYWLERSNECDLSYVVAYGSDFKERRQETIAGAYGIMTDRGTCIVRSKARLSDADLIVFARRWQKFPQPSTFSPIASGIRASRSGIYKPNDHSILQTLWQKTSIAYSTLKPILAHSWRQSGYSLEAEWWRTHFRPDPHMNLKDTLAAMKYKMPKRLR